MLSKREMLQLLTALARMNDLHVIATDSGLNEEICAPEDRVCVRHLGDLIDRLRQSFDYRQSPEFSAKVDGKSEAYRAMLERLVQDPVKRKSNLARFDSALVEIVSSGEIFELAAATDHSTIEEIRRRVRALNNPD